MTRWQRQSTERSTADALEHAESDQQFFGWRDGAQPRPYRKQGQRREEDQLRADAVTQVAHDRNDCRLRQEVARHDPGDRSKIRMERFEHLWERDAHNRIFKNCHKQAQRHDQRGLPFIKPRRKTLGL